MDGITPPFEGSGLIKKIRFRYREIGNEDEQSIEARLLMVLYHGFFGLSKNWKNNSRNFKFFLENWGLKLQIA